MEQADVEHPQSREEKQGGGGGGGLEGSGRVDKEGRAGGWTQRFNIDVNPRRFQSDAKIGRAHV